MQVQIKIEDKISPHLARQARALADRRPMLEGMGLALVSMTQRAFQDSALRPASWAPVKKGGLKNAPLRLSGALYQSIKLSGLNNNSVTVSSDRRYAAIHQLGGKTRPHIIRPTLKKALAWPGGAHPVRMVRHPGSRIPARPFFPFLPSGDPSSAAERRLRAVMQIYVMQIIRKP